MAKITKGYKLPHKRRREKRTDYRARLRLIRSGKVRLVIRKSSSHMNVQFIDYVPEGDRTVVAANSQELKKYGWKGGTGNIPAAYLTGLLAGTRAKDKIKEA
ncbi:MAG: 50S ribosomal protein L18, partial [Candidatus Aenigmatarchaeota archaeon]